MRANWKWPEIARSISSLNLGKECASHNFCIEAIQVECVRVDYPGSVAHLRGPHLSNAL